MSAQENPMQRIISKCWEDDAFKERLMADPAATLAAEGVEVPDGVTVSVVEDTARVRHLVIPAAPGMLHDGELEEVAAGIFPDPAACARSPILL